MSINGAWDSATSFAFTLSNGDKTATSTGANGAVDTTDSNSTGKFYAEITVTTVKTGNAIAIFDTTFTDALQWTLTTGAWVNSASGSGTIQTLASGNIAGIALDLTAHLVWFRTGAGNWNNSALANPATGIGGLALPHSTGNPYLIEYNTLTTTGGVATVNTGTSAFANAAPIGFTGWYVPAAGSVGASTGAGVATGVGRATAASTGASAGAGAATGIGRAASAAVGAASGAGTATGVGRAILAAVGAAAGAGTATGIGASAAASVGSAAGAGIATGVGISTAASVGSAAGAGTATGIGAATIAAIGSASGAGTAIGIGAALVSAVGSSAGAGTASGVASAGTTNGVGSAAGAGTAMGAGASLVKSVGSASGAGTAIGVGAALFEAVGTASGSATVLGIAAGGPTPPQPPSEEGGGGLLTDGIDRYLKRIRESQKASAARDRAQRIEDDELKALVERAYRTASSEEADAGDDEPAPPPAPAIQRAVDIFRAEMPKRPNPAYIRVVAELERLQAETIARQRALDEEDELIAMLLMAA